MSGGGEPTRVLLLCGGRSGEHEVSLASAASVLEAASSRVRFVPRVIARDGRLLDDENSRRALAAGGNTATAAGRDDADDGDGGGDGHGDGSGGDRGTAAAHVRDAVRKIAAITGEVDVVFPLLHGPNGEDGTVQGLLRTLDVPFVGSDVLGSAASMDKPTMKRVFAAERLPQVAWAEVDEARWRADPGAVREALAPLGLPLFVKPANLGSSVGIGRADDAAGLDAALGEAFRHDRRGIVEAAVPDAREIEVAVLGDEDPAASPPGEIRVRNQGFYDYDNKYGSDAAELIVPADLDPTVAARLRELAVRAYRAVHACGLARVDFFLTSRGEILLNEINTMPGFTRHSMYPKLWQAGGLAYPDLIVRLVGLALERHARESAIGRTAAAAAAP